MIYKIVLVGGKARLEHRLVMENFLGRPLLHEEVVHHIDRNSLNNSIENLMLTDVHKHNALHERIVKNTPDIILKIMSIGKFSSATGISVKTLKSWDVSGKFKAKRYPSGRRFYTDEQAEQVLQGRVKGNAE